MKKIEYASHEKEQAESLDAGDRKRNSHELNEFALAVGEMINDAQGAEQLYLAELLRKIKADIEKWKIKYDRAFVSFHEAYEEVTSLYVFTEMYLKVDNRKSD